MNATKNGNVTFVGTNKFWREFIELYQKHPALWDMNSECYRNRALKKESYKILTDKLKEIDENATYIDVKRRINSLRSCHRRELRRAKKCRKAGLPFTSGLWYFDDFAFIRKNASAKTVSSDDDDSRDPTSTSISKFRDKEMANWTKRRPDKQPQPDKPPHSDKASHSDKYLQSDNPTMAVAKQDDESEIFGKSWVLKYRRLSEPQKIFAMRAIDEIFYKGLLGQLCERTTIMELPLERNETYSDPNTEQYAMSSIQQGYEPPYFEAVSIKVDEEHLPTSDF